MMTMIFSTIGLILLVTLVASLDKFARHHNEAARLVFWACAIVLIVVLALDNWHADYKSNPAPPAAVDARTLAVAFADAELELLKYNEIDAVSFKGDEETGELVIRLFVNDGADETFQHEIQDETVRILIHAMADNCEIPALIGNRSFLSRLRISVIFVRNNSEQALP